MNMETENTARPVAPQQTGVSEQPGFLFYRRLNPTAVLFDGAYFLKRIRHILKLKPEELSATATAEMVSAIANDHAEHFNGELYRIFFYDCAPFTGKARNPISKNEVDFSKTPLAKFRKELHDSLKIRRKLALRLGYLRLGHWGLKKTIFDLLVNGKTKWENISENDVQMEFEQKAVDMKIGLDISSIALKGRVRTIILVAGDGDFIPATKTARREGVDFIIDPMGQHITDALEEHVDGLRCAPISSLYGQIQNSSKMKSL